MIRIQRFFRTASNRVQQRGSALLATLMVMVGLSLLGLGFVAISETESAISMNQRNHSETVAAAEAGARLVVQWFQNPTQMQSLNLMPGNNVNNMTYGGFNTLKTQRVVGTYTGYYKSASAGALLCDLPYSDDDGKFFGAEDSPDIVIDRTTDFGRAFLDNFNNRLFGAEDPTQARPSGEITRLALFAPPIAGGTLTAPNPPHFWDGGTRYGVCTILARAEKFDRPNSVAGRQSIAMNECRIVLSQFPLPTPGGPLQSQTGLATNGNFNVNWGMVSAEQTLNLKKDYQTLPWFNAYERIHFQRGYDSSYQYGTNKVFRTGDIVRPTPAAIAANAALRGHEYSVVSVPASGVNTGAAAEPAWTIGAGSTLTQTIGANTITYTERQPTAWPVSVGANGPDTVAWLYYIARGNISVTDPWFQARSAQDITGEPNANPQPNPFPWNSPSTYGNTHHFQYQSFDQYPDFKQLLFPFIDYNFWKGAALAGNGQNGVKYLTWVSADQFTDGITTQSMQAWSTSTPGFYFFETQNNQNPQNGGPGLLTPQATINGVTNYMSSFIYFNGDFGTTGAGAGGPTGWFNQPGEPYMDIGYRQVDTGTGNFVTDASGMPVVAGAVNNQWDYQDLPWSNSGATSGAAPGPNGKFDVCVAQRVVHDPSDTANPNSTYTGWFPIPYVPGCKPGNNIDMPACTCSEPHEPYLNIQYNTATLGITVGWFDPATPVATRRKPILTDTGLRSGTPITCTDASTQSQCTSNAYDITGGLVQLSPATDGVLYIEGQFNSKGNWDYYGSVLVGKGGVNSQGTPNIWYDESLSRGLRLPGFPRVMVTSVQTDK